MKGLQQIDNSSGKSYFLVVKISGTKKRDINPSKVCKPMNHAESLIPRLKNYSKESIIFSTHAKEQAIFRGILLDEIRENIINPKRLVFAGRQEAEHLNEEKYDCYFAYSKTQCHRYVLVINAHCIVCTVIKINRRWQHQVEKYAKI